MEHRVRLTLAAVSLVATAACASAPSVPERTSLPVLAAGDTDAKLGYEVPPVLHAQDVLNPELRESEHHTVSDRVASDGFMLRYSIDSEFGSFDAYGNDALRARVAEIRALAELQQFSRGAEFASALQRSLASPFVATWNLVTRPVATLSGLPRGAAGIVDPAEFIGFERSKREIAYRLGVDAYSPNPALQRELNRFAWVATVGGLGESLFSLGASAAAPAGRGERELLRDYPPAELQRLHRVELAVMGVPEATAESFVTHPWYSPRQRALLVSHLAALDLVGGRGALISQALRAASAEDAELYTRSAELLRAYHERVAELDTLAPFRAGTVCAFTRDARLVAVLPVDYAIWSRPMEGYADALQRAAPSDGRAVGSRELLLTGSLSPKAREQLRARGIAVHERALETLRAGHEA